MDEKIAFTKSEDRIFPIARQIGEMDDWEAAEKVILFRLFKNGQMQGARNPEE